MKFPFFIHSKQKDWSVGIDLGATNVKIVCLSKNESSGYELKAHGFFRRDHREAFVSSLRMKEILRASVRVNIDDLSLKIRRVFLPQVPQEELPEIVKWASKDFVTGSVHDYTYRFHVTSGGGEKNKIPYLIYAVAKKAVSDHVDSLVEMGMPRPEIVEPSSAALALNSWYNGSLVGDNRVILIDLGGVSSSFVVAGAEGLLFSRPLGNISGGILTKHISRNLGVSELEAEKMKLAGENGIGREYRMNFKNTVSNFFTSAVLEIQRSLDLYQTQMAGGALKKIFFTGGASHLEGFVFSVAKTLNIETEMLDPFEKVDLGSFVNAEALAQKKNFYGVACGLAL